MKQFKKYATKYPADANPLEVIQETLNDLTNALGKKYKLFEYFGSPEAKTVLVSFGARTLQLPPSISTNIAIDSTVFEQAATLSNGNVGVLSVRFYRPWATQQFLANLPSTVKNIVVLENSDQARYYYSLVRYFAYAFRTGRGALFRDVAGSFYSKFWRRAVPQITSAAVPKATNDSTPAFAAHFITQLEQSNQIDFEALESNDQSIRFLDIETQQAVFWDLKSAQINEDTLDLLSRNYGKWFVHVVLQALLSIFVAGVQGYFAYDNFEHVRRAPRSLWY